MTTITERPHQYSYSANEIRYVFQVSNPTAPGCTVEVEIYYLDQNVPTLLHTLTPLTPTVQGTIFCDIRSYLKSVLAYQLPIARGAAIEPVTDQIKKYYIRYRQVTDADTDPDWTDDSANTLIVLLGGIEQIKFRRSNFFINYLPQNKLFLTWMPADVRFVHLNQKHYLTFLLLQPSATVTTLFQVFYTDGTVILTSSDHNTNGNLLFRMKTGVEDVALHTINPGKKIHYYQVTVREEYTLAFAGPYRFYVDYRPVYKYWDLFYFNSLGGLDAVRIKGAVDWVVESSFDEVTHVAYNDSPDSDHPNAQFSFANVVKRDVFKGDAGWNRSKLEQEAMIEMFLHPIYELINYRWIRIMNLKKSQDLRNTTDKKWSFPVEFTYGYEDTVYTPKEISLGAGVGETPDVCIGVDIDNGFALPDGNEGQPYDVSIPILAGTAPFALNVTQIPSWITIQVTGMYVRLFGTPNQTGANNVAFVITNCFGGNNDSYTKTFNVAAAPCVPVSIEPVNLPDGQMGTPYPPGQNQFAHTIYLNGTAPFTLTNVVKPTWMTLNVGPDFIDISGTPDAEGTNIPVSFTVNNCNGATANFSDTINIASACVPVSIEPVSLPDGKFNEPYPPGQNQLFHTIYLSGTPPFALTNVVKPVWMTITVGPDFIDLSGTPNVIANNVQVSFIVHNCSNSTASFNDMIDIKP